MFAQLIGLVFGWKFGQHVQRSGGWGKFASSAMHLREPAVEPTTDERILQNAIEFGLRQYSGVAKWFLMHAFRSNWRNELPGAPGKLASINLGVVGGRIRMGWTAAGIWTGIFGFGIGAYHGWNPWQTSFDFSLTALVLVGLVGPFRWIGAYVFAPCSLAYACYRKHRLVKCNKPGYIAILMHDYGVMISFGSVIFMGSGWLVGLRSFSVYHAIAYTVLAIVGAIVARTILANVPSSLFARDPDVIAVVVSSTKHKPDADETTYDSESDVDEECDVAPQYANVGADVPDQCDTAAFRWESAFPAVDGRLSVTDLEPKLTRRENGEFRFDESVPLRPPTFD